MGDGAAGGIGGQTREPKVLLAMLDLEPLPRRLKDDPPQPVTDLFADSPAPTDIGFRQTPVAANFHPGFGSHGSSTYFAVANPEASIEKGWFCKAVGGLSQGSAALDAVGGFYDDVFTVLAKGDKLLTDPIDRAVLDPLFQQADSPTFNEWRGLFEWAGRGAVAAVVAAGVSRATYGTRSKAAVAKAEAAGTEAAQTSKWLTGKQLGNIAKLVGVGWLMASEVLANPDKLINMFGGTGWTGDARNTTRNVVMGAQTVGAAVLINHSYRSRIDGAGKIAFGVGAAWMGFWLAYVSYFEASALQERGLTAIDGAPQGAGSNPLNWKGEYFSPSFVSSNFGSWAASAPIWGALGGVSVGGANKTWRAAGKLLGRDLGSGFNDVIKFSAAEKAELAGLRGPVKWAKAFQKTFFNPKRVAYTANMYLWGLLIGMGVSRAMQVARAFESDAALHGSTVRPIFTSALSALGFTPVKAVGASISSYGYYAGGMLFLFPYEYCNEQQEAFGQLGKEMQSRFSNSTDPAERTALWARVQQFAIASRGEERDIVVPLAEAMDAALTSADEAYLRQAFAALDSQ